MSPDSGPARKSVATQPRDAAPTCCPGAQAGGPALRSVNGEQSAAPRSLLARRLLLVLLSVQFVGLGLLQAWTDSLTFDESPDIGIGLSALVHRDLRLIPEHPPLAPVLAALPALAAEPVVPKGAAWIENRWFDHVEDVVIAQRDDGRLRWITFLCRIVPVGVGLGAGLLLYVIAERLSDWRGGLLAAGLWLTTPVIVGYAHLAGLDVPFTATVLLVVWALLLHLDQPTTRSVTFLGAALGLSLATRHTAFVLIPTAVALVVWQHRRDLGKAVRPVALVLLVPLAVVWGVYRAIDPSGPPEDVRKDFEARIAAAGEASILADLALAIPLPLEHRAGLARLMLAEDDRPAYLVGHAWEGGRWWFFPVSAALKLPLSVPFAVFAGAVLWARGRAPRRRAVLLACVVPASAIATVLLVQPLNLGLRYAFPVVALGLVLTAPLVTTQWGGRHAVVALVAVCQLVSTYAAHPHSIAWTPPPFEPGYRLVSDGNLDIGQGHGEVMDWSAAQREPVWFAMVHPRGMPRLEPRLPPGGPAEVPALVVVGASSLTVYERHELSWLRAHCPIRLLAGGSVLVYRFELRPDTSPGPDRPAPPCPRSEVSRRVR